MPYKGPLDYLFLLTESLTMIFVLALRAGAHDDEHVKVRLQDRTKVISGSSFFEFFRQFASTGLSLRNIPHFTVS